MNLTDDEARALAEFCQIMAQREGEDLMGIFMKTGLFRLTSVAALAEKLEAFLPPTAK